VSNGYDEAADVADGGKVPPMTCLASPAGTCAYADCTGHDAAVIDLTGLIHDCGWRRRIVEKPPNAIMQPCLPALRR
jgi:hypothetical protein